MSKPDPSSTRVRKPAQHKTREEVVEQELDDALAGTFPASDPVAVDAEVTHPDKDAPTGKK